LLFYAYESTAVVRQIPALACPATVNIPERSLATVLLLPIPKISGFLRVFLRGVFKKEQSTPSGTRAAVTAPLRNRVAFSAKRASIGTREFTHRKREKRKDPHGRRYPPAFPCRRPCAKHDIVLDAMSLTLFSALPVGPDPTYST
jgi:hypothetical protein